MNLPMEAQPVDPVTPPRRGEMDEADAGGLEYGTPSTGGYSGAMATLTMGNSPVTYALTSASSVGLDEVATDAKNSLREAMAAEHSVLVDSIGSEVSLDSTKSLSSRLVRTRFPV